jgi:hypothetical protein
MRSGIFVGGGVVALNLPLRQTGGVDDGGRRNPPEF